jgi:acyl carrier protein
MSDVLAELQPIFRDILDQPKLQIVRSSNASNVDGWDSLAHINLVTAIEQRFGISFALGELEGLKDVGEMIDLVEKKMGKR